MKSSTVDCKYLGRLLSTILLLAAMALAKQATAQNDLEVSFVRDRGLITVHAVDVPLDDVLDAIGEAVGIEILKQIKLEAPVSLDLVDTPVKSALELLLGRSNFVVKEDLETQLPVKLWLLSAADFKAIDGMREAQPIATEAEGTSRPNHQRAIGEVAELLHELRTELWALGEGESEREILENLGLTSEEQEDILRIIDEMDAAEMR